MVVATPVAVLTENYHLPEMRVDILSKVHSSNQDIVHCRLRVSNSVWWPEVSKEVEKFVQSCSECLNVNKPPKKSHAPTKLLYRSPMRNVASDLFGYNSTFLLLVDYYSG